MVFASVVMAVVLFVVLLLGVSAASDLSRRPARAVGGHHAGGARDVQLTTSDGLRLGAWYVPRTRRGRYVHGSGCQWQRR